MTATGLWTRVRKYIIQIQYTYYFNTQVASDEDMLVDTVFSTITSRSTSCSAAEADRDLHLLHLVYLRQLPAWLSGRLSWQRGAAR